MSLGEVDIQPFEGGENIAQYVAFAASVAGMSSSTKAISEIGRALGLATREHGQIKLIAAPLLGAGAGGLESGDVVAALRDGFRSASIESATLVIHVLHRAVFDRIWRRAASLSRKEIPAVPVRVFVSHTSDSDDKRDWVKALATALRQRGIQARVDAFHLRRGMDLPQWMCNELALAQKVVIVSDETYKQKVDGRLGGVGWETMLIQGDMANLPAASTKYQVVVRANKLSDGLPNYLRRSTLFMSAGERPWIKLLTTWRGSSWTCH
jgi:hypothetical protein